MEKLVYDLIVIGGGPAGYNGAERAAEAGLKVALVEKNELGGVCLNSGCIPSKTFLNTAKMLDHAVGGAKYGLVLDGDAYVDQKALVARKNKVVKILVAGIKQKLKKLGVDVYKAVAFVDGKEDDLFRVSLGDGKIIYAKNILVASGSSAFIPPIPGIHASLKDGFAVTNAEVFDMIEIPRQLVVIGGGVIGVELAEYFGSVGSNVVIVEAGKRILPQIDLDIVGVLEKRLLKKGIKIISGARVIRMGDQKVTLRIDGENIELPCDKVLVATGRRPNHFNLGLEKLGLDISGGKIYTNSRLETGTPGIYATGDVNGISTLAHTAYRESEVAVNNITGTDDRMSYDTVPSVVYTSPEIASVGLSEEVATANDRKVKIVKIPLSYSGRYVAENDERDGFAKLILDENGKKLLGFSAIGPYSGEYVTLATSFIDLEVDIDRIQKIIFPHPTVSEIIREGLFIDD